MQPSQHKQAAAANPLIRMLTAHCVTTALTVVSVHCCCALPHPLCPALWPHSAPICTPFDVIAPVDLQVRDEDVGHHNKPHLQKEPHKQGWHMHLVHLMQVERQARYVPFNIETYTAKGAWFPHGTATTDRKHYQHTTEIGCLGILHSKHLPIYHAGV